MMTGIRTGLCVCTHADIVSDHDPVPTDANQVKRLLRRHKRIIGRWLNVLELLPYLSQHRLIKSEKDRVRLRSLHSREKRSKIVTRICKTLASSNRRDSGAYTEFLRCLQDESEHLGHHYVAKLLQGVRECELAEELVLNFSRLVCNSMCAIEPLIQSHLSLKDLLPHLRQKKLLTLSEFEYLHEDSACENSWKIQKLLSILSTKGPTAYYLFFQCLEQERAHRGHEYIYKELCHLIDVEYRNEMSAGTAANVTVNEEGFTLIAVYKPHMKTPCRLGLEGSLAGEEHIGEMRTLQQHRYHGRWDRFRQGINGLTKSDDINVMVVGKLHNAVASIMSGNTNLSLCLVDEVEKMCSTLYGNNSQIMIGRCHYIRSAVYRHRQDYDSARYYLDLSNQKLENSEPGADTASLYYHEGTLQLDLLQQSGSHSRKRRDATERSFRMAVEHAEHDNSGLPLIAWHSKVFLALLYLGSSHDSVAHVLPSTADLNRAESILNTLDYDQLPPRTLALYHIAYSDIYRWKSDLSSARHNAKLGLTKAEQGNFAFEKRFATHRLQCL